MSGCSIPRILLAIGTVITGAGFFVTLGGLSALQHQAFELNVGGATNYNETAPLTVLYTQTFQSGLYIPYPFQPTYQFEWTWFILFAELTIWLLTAWLNVYPAHVRPARLVVLAWVASFQVIIWEHINTVLFFSRNDIAKFAFGAERLNAALAGLFIVAIGNGTVVTALGLYSGPEPSATLNSSENGCATVAAKTGKAVSNSSSSDSPV